MAHTIAQIADRFPVNGLALKAAHDRNYSMFLTLAMLRQITASTDWPGGNNYRALRDLTVQSISEETIPEQEARRRTDRSNDEKLMRWLMMDWGCAGHASPQELYQWRNWARAFPQETRDLALECGFDAFAISSAKAVIRTKMRSGEPT